MNWADFSQAVGQATGGVRDWFREFTNIPSKASDIADRAFPTGEYERDLSTQNAYRHSLGTGMMTRHLGGGPIAAGAAKAMGYIWEAPNLLNPQATPQVMEDTRHDLNANAVGSAIARQVGSQQELEAVLRSFASNAVNRPAPGLSERSPGYLTRSKR